MPDPKSADWQAPDFLGDNWETAIQEIAKIRAFVREELQNTRKYQAQFGVHLDSFNSVPTPHERQGGSVVPERIRTALQAHQIDVGNLMASGKEIWNLWSEWKEQVWKEYTSRYSVHDALHHEWTRVCMNGYTFSNACDFAEFSFPNEISFNQATFSGIATFNDAKFAQRTSFDGATFSDDAQFNGTIFEHAPSFVGATFSKDFEFDRPYSSIPFRIFGSEQDVKNRPCRRAPTRRDDFEGVPFPVEGDFSSATFFQEVDFDGQQFLHKAKFSDATFAGGASFLGARFRYSANFVGATFQHKAYFSYSIFRGQANFENAVFTSETSFINTKFAEPPVFHGAKLHPSTAFSPGLGLWGQFNKLDTKGARDCFRTLKNHFKNQDAQFEANLFYALEMRATMHEEREAGKRWRAGLIWAYDGFTDFGLSVFRPLACWLGVQILMTVILVLLSFANSGLINSVINSFSLAFLNSLALPGLVDSNLFASQIATVFQIDQPTVYATMLEFSRRFPGVAFVLGLAKVLSVGFIFLTLLALRNRFRIK